jgi:adenosylmethionine-8-amino-7-oxononanoate aminotransferase
MHEASPGVAVLKKALLDNGLVTLIRGHHVHCTPPLIVTAEQIEEGIEKLDKSLYVLDEWIASH